MRKRINQYLFYFEQISAIVNVGWKPSANSNEWLRKGDYLTDTHTKIESADNDTTIKQDVPVKLYD